MKPEKFYVSSQTIELAEHDDYLELINRVCYYDDVNKNNVMLPSLDAEEKAQTLINMPVQAKYRTNMKGEPTFGGHEMKKTLNGDVIFDTSSIGTHTEVYVENADVDVNGIIKNLPCLYAKYRVWKRYPNYVEAVKRLFSLNKLFSSWEIVVLDSEFKSDVKVINDYRFIANTLLGYEFASPAYGKSAKAICLSSKNEDMSADELMVAEALSKDLIILSEDDKDSNINKSKKKERDNMKKSNKQSIEGASLTSYDLRKKLNEACRFKFGDWCWVSYVFPEEHYCLCEYDGESELDYLKFNYTVENDVVSVSEPEEITLKVSVKDINEVVENYETEISNYEETISKKDDAIIKASKEITLLKKENVELSEYKDKFDKIESERIEAELQEKKENLISTVVKSGQITREEIEASEEMMNYVNSLDKKSLMAIVAEKLIASIDDSSNDGSFETSTVNKRTKAEHISSNLNNDDDVLDSVAVMRNYIRK